MYFSNIADKQIISKKGNKAMENQKLNFKEFLTITSVSLLATPIVYQIVFADFMWWLK